MKIKGIHSVCGREVLVQQILENQGHCPWDGKPFNKDYTALLAQALAKAEAAGSLLEDALDEVAEMGGDLVLDETSVLAGLETALERNRGARPASVR